MKLKCAVTVLLLGTLLLPGKAAAQSTEGWEVTLAPLYLWASSIDGEVSVNRATTPTHMSFGDAVDNLAGIFTFHAEARKGRWGVFSDLGYVRLSTESEFTVPGLLPSAPNRVVTGEMELRNVIFEGGASYLVSRAREFSIIAGVRTYTMAPTIEFTGANNQVTPVDASTTELNAFGGFLFRPKIAEKWFLATRADVGGGAGFTWSTTAALQFQMTKRAGLLFGYHALGVDTGEVGSASQLPAGTGNPAVNFHMTHHGPIVALNLRWGGN